MKKRGQFYLIATIVFVAMIIGFVTISSPTENNKTKKLENIKEEFETEGLHILDFVVYNGYDDDRIDERWDIFTQSYVDNVQENIKIILITGKQENLKAKIFEKDNEITMLNIEDSNNKVKVTYLGKNEYDYEFPITKGENFHFVIIKEENNEIYAITN